MESPSIKHMQDSELKKLLLETCPVLPGQENRAWTALRERLARADGKSSPRAWLFFPSRRGLTIAVSVAIALFIAGQYFGIGVKPLSLATADSQAPGIFATSFYSAPAQAQVVWLNGMAPVSDNPTYLDPTTVIQGKGSSATSGDPNSL